MLFGGITADEKVKVINGNTIELKPINSDEDLTQIGSLFKVVYKKLEDGQSHFIVNIDDFIEGGIDGEIMSHELGHAEGHIKNPANMYRYAGDKEKGHSSGNKSGENANTRQQEYKDGN